MAREHQTVITFTDRIEYAKMTRRLAKKLSTSSRRVVTVYQAGHLWTNH